MKIPLPKLPEQFLRKTLAALALIACAGVATVLIKGSIDSLDPENALPEIYVNIGYAVPSVQRAGYEWNFLTTIRRSPTVSPPDLALTVTPVDGGVPVTVRFSSAYETLRVSRADGLGSTDYSLINGDVQTPAAPGYYIYCVEAGFSKGSIIYYFAVEVR